MKIDLSGKTALVCGSTFGIGNAIAKAFAEAGAKLVLAARTESELEKLSRTLPNAPHRFIVADFFENESFAAQIKKIAAEGTKLDVVVNNAGGPPPGALLEADANELIKAFEAHVATAQKLAKIIVPKMKESRWGRIINIISIGLKQPIPNLGVSNVVRGAMGAWAKTLSLELAPFGITVNNILPGYTETSRLIALFEKNAAREKISSKEYADKIKSTIPAKRFASPEEIANAALFLASDYAAYINGVNLPVDGGFLNCL